MASSIVASSLYAGMHTLTPAVYRWREIVSICCSGTTSIKFIAPSRQAREEKYLHILPPWHALRPCSGHALRLWRDQNFIRFRFFWPQRRNLVGPVWEGV